MHYKQSIACIIVTFLSYSCSLSQPSAAENEVIYHVFQRSFYDSNGDQHGDLKGLQSKLDYIRELGATSILLLPLYHSEFYHNYFATDFEAIDPEFGTLQDYIDLVREVHQRGMKIYMDMETQYVTEDHEWYVDSYGNPNSAYSDYLVYHGPGNTNLEPIVWDLTELIGYDGTIRKVTTVDMLSKEVLDYNKRLFSFWVDPNKDGNFEDGVDGFRLDHMMDKLDYKERFSNLFEKFWTPLITSVKMVNPKIIFLAEQANWESYGIDYLQKGNADRICGFNLKDAFASFDKERLTKVMDSSFAALEDQHQLIVLLENHDTDRLASRVDNNADKLKLGAAFVLFSPGTPLIYYGQEIGMKGIGGFGKYGNTDGNDIPRREAFEWYRTVTGNGMTLWYQNSGPWWDQSSLKDNDGISFEEQQSDPNSLYHAYRQLLSLRKTQPALYTGSYNVVSNNHPSVFTFVREKGDDKLLIAMNLAGTESKASIGTVCSSVEQLYGNAQILREADSIDATLPPYGFFLARIQ